MQLTAQLIDTKTKIGLAKAGQDNDKTDRAFAFFQPREYCRAEILEA